MKSYTYFLIATLLGSMLLFISCNKDKDPPVITILGDNPYRIELGETYQDPGATAVDDTDGDVTTSIQTTIDVNTNLKGIYHVTYAVTDQEGNSIEEVRTVIVFNSVDFLTGDWDVTDHKVDPQGNPTQSDYVETIIPSDSINGRFWVSTFGSYTNGIVYINKVTGSEYEIPQQEVQCGTPSKNRRFMGTATVTDTNNIVVNYTEIVAPENFTGSATYVRQE